MESRTPPTKEKARSGRLSKVIPHASHHWHMPVIPATQEAEIRKMGSMPAQANSSRDSILKKTFT
jgi:hypothetical protein